MQHTTVALFTQLGSEAGCSGLPLPFCHLHDIMSQQELINGGCWQIFLQELRLKLLHYASSLFFGRHGRRRTVLALHMCFCSQRLSAMAGSHAHTHTRTHELQAALLQIICDTAAFAKWSPEALQMTSSKAATITSTGNIQWALANQNNLTSSASI